MITSTGEWLRFLQASDAIIGFPLVVGGAVLMMAGWRLWRICTCISFALVGHAAGAMIGAHGDMQIVYSLAGAAVLGVGSCYLAKNAVSLLGGVIGAGICLRGLSALGVSGPTLWAIGAVSLIGFTAYAMTNRLRVVIIVTAFLGACLAMSGLAAFLMASPALYAMAQNWLASSAMVAPFILIVPTIVSCFHQASEANRLSFES